MPYPMQETMNPPQPPRRSTLGIHLLRRSKSGDLGKGQRKASKEQRPRRDSISKSPPKLPDFVQPTANLERLSNAFGRDTHPDSASIMSGGTGVYSPRPSMDPGRGYVGTVPIPPVPPMPAAWDPYSRAESMAHRGRYSYSSSAMSTVNSPRRVRRRKDPTPFNILIVGAHNSGKTSFLEFLKTALALPAKKRSRKTMHEDEQPANKAVRRGNFVPHYLETELDGESVGLTIWDSEGFEKNVVDLQLRELSSFVESKFEDTLNEEMKVMRSPGFQDTHIHAVFLVLDPSRLDRNLAAARSMSSSVYQGVDSDALFTPVSHAAAGALDDDLDLQVVRTLQGKTTVIPVISKADTITTKHMSVLKRSVWDSLKKANLDPLEALGMDEDDDSAIDTSRIEERDEEEHDDIDVAGSVHSIPDEDAKYVVSNGPHQMGYEGNADFPMRMRSSPTSPTSPTSKRLSGSSIRRHKAQEEAKVDEEVPFLPLSIISPDLYEPSVIGRKFPWGFADPYDEKHCDFVRLKEAVFNEWRPELREASREQWYEGWRTSRLKGRESGNRRR